MHVHRRETNLRVLRRIEDHCREVLIHGILRGWVQPNRANKAPGRVPMPTATAVLCL
jgi:hypothetical protein